MAWIALLVFGLTGCGAAYYGAIAAIIATQKKTTTTQTSFPDAVATGEALPAFAELQLSSAPVTITRTTNGTTSGPISGTTTVTNGNTGQVTITDFEILGVKFPAGYGQAVSQRDTSTLLKANDKLLVRVNGDTPQAISFAAADVASVGTDVAARIAGKVRALAPIVNTVPKEAYLFFTSTYDPSTGAYTFVSGSPGETSEVVWNPDPRPNTNDVAPDDVSVATAARLGLGAKNGELDTAGADTISVIVLNRGNDTIPSGTGIDLFLSHTKVLDTSAIKFDKITTDQTVQVGEARLFKRRNGNAPPDRLVRSDITPGNYYVIFQVNPSNGETATPAPLVSRHTIEVYQPAQDPAITTSQATNTLDFVITSTQSPIGLVTGNNFSSVVTVSNFGAPVTAATNIDLDFVLSSNKILDEPAAFLDPAGLIAGVRVNPTDPNRSIAIQIDGTSTQPIAATVNNNTIKVSYNAGASGAAVAMVQSLTDVLNQKSGGLVDAFPDGRGSPTTQTLNSLLKQANIVAASTVVATDIFVATKTITFAATPLPNQSQSFFISGQVRTTAFNTALLPLKLFPLFRIRPHLNLAPSDPPENTKNNIRQAGNYVRIYDRLKAQFDSLTGAKLPTVNADDFTQLAGIIPRPVNTGTIRQGQQRVFQFQLPDTTLAFAEAQLLVILRASGFDAHMDLLSSSGDFLTGNDDSALGLDPVIYAPVQSSETSRVFYLVVSPARADESDLAGGNQTFDLTISVNVRQPADIGLVKAVTGDNALQRLAEAYAPLLNNNVPTTQNNVLIPFSLTNAKAEIAFIVPQRSRIKFKSTPVFLEGVGTTITQFRAGSVPSPVEFQAELDTTFKRIVYRPKGSDINTPHVLDGGVYTIAFEGLNQQADGQAFRVEIETQFIPDSVSPGQH